MKSNKGFTLIELLAVIVILAIIALIATPMILGVVETARKGAAESSVLGFVDAVEKQVMINELEENAIVDGTYAVASANNGATLTGSGTAAGKTYTVEVKGEVPTADSMEISSGQVATTTFTLNSYTVTYNKSTGKASATK